MLKKFGRSRVREHCICKCSLANVTLEPLKTVHSVWLEAASVFLLLVFTNSKEACHCCQDDQGHVCLLTCLLRNRSYSL